MVDAQLASTFILDRRLRKLAERKQFSLDDTKFFPVRAREGDGLRSLYEAVYPALLGYSDIFLYSPHVAAFFEMAVEKGYLLDGRISPAAEIFNTLRFGGKDDVEAFFEELACKYRSSEFQEAYRKRWGRISRCDRSINQLFHRALVLSYPKGLIAVGVDLFISPFKAISDAGQTRHVPIAIEDAMSDMLRARTRFVKNFDEYQELRGHLGWAQVPSVGVHAGPIVHCVVFYPADSGINARQMAAKIGSRWSTLIGIPNMYHSWSSDQNSYKRSVCGLISTSELSSIRNFYHLAYYMAMKGFWLGPRMPDGSDLYFRSELFNADGTRKKRQRGLARSRDASGPDFEAGDTAAKKRRDSASRTNSMRSLAKATRPRKISPSVAAASGEQGDLLYPQAVHVYTQLLNRQVVADEEERERLRLAAEAKAHAAATVSPMITRTPDYSTWVASQNLVSTGGIPIDSDIGQAKPADPKGAGGLEFDVSNAEAAGPIGRALAAGLKAEAATDPLERAGLNIVPKSSKRSEMASLRKPGYKSGVLQRPAQAKRSSETHPLDDGERDSEGES